MKILITKVFQVDVDCQLEQMCTYPVKYVNVYWMIWETILYIDIHFSEDL